MSNKRKARSTNKSSAAHSSSSSASSYSASFDPNIDFNPSLHPRSSKRSKISDSSNNMSGRRVWGRSSSSSSGVNNSAITELFDAIADSDDPDIADMEGVCKLSEDLGIDPFEDIRILVLLQKLGAKAKPGQISRTEFIEGCTKLHVDSIDKFKMLLPSLDTGFMEDSEFREFYKFCFQFNRQGTHKTLDKDLVVDLVKMVLQGGRVPDDRITTFQNFLKASTDASYNTITQDQWLSFFDFCKDCQNLEDYDEDTSAWPVLIDDFAEYAINAMKM